MGAHEEAIHVPFIIHNPKLIPISKSVNIAQPLVGKNLTPLILSNDSRMSVDEPIYFMTDDDVTKGLNQRTFLGIPYKSVIQPNHIETVIVKLHTGKNK